MKVDNFYTYQRTKGQRYGKLPAKVAEQTLWNKLSVDTIYNVDFKNPYICYPKKLKKER